MGEREGRSIASRLPADDQLQLLVGPLNQGDGLSPGAAQFHLVDVHHFIASLQLGRQGGRFTSLFDLQGKERRTKG